MGRKKVGQCLALFADGILFLYGIALLIAAYYLSTYMITALVGQSIPQVAMGFGILTLLTACYSRLADMRRWSLGFYVEVFSLLVLFFLESTVVLYCIFQFSEKKDMSLEFWEKLHDNGKMLIMSNWDCCGWDTTCNTNIEIFYEYRVYVDTLCYSATESDYKMWVMSVSLVLGTTSIFHLLYILYPCVCQGRRLRRKREEKIRVGATRKLESSDSERTSSSGEYRTALKLAAEKASAKKSAKRSKQIRLSRSGSFNQGRSPRRKRGYSRRKRRDSRNNDSDLPLSPRKANRAARVRPENATPIKGRKVDAKPNKRQHAQHPSNILVDSSNALQPAVSQSVNSTINNAIKNNSTGRASQRSNSVVVSTNFIIPVHSRGSTVELYSPAKSSAGGSSMSHSNALNVKSDPLEHKDPGSKSLRRSQSEGTAFNEQFYSNTSAATNPSTYNSPTNHTSSLVNNRTMGSKVRSTIPYFPDNQQHIVHQINPSEFTMSSQNTGAMQGYPSSVKSMPIHGSSYSGSINAHISEAKISQSGSLYTVLVPNKAQSSEGQFHPIEYLHPV